MTNPFKVGDKVKCISGNGEWIIRGSVYTVSGVTSNYVGLVEDPESGNGWHKRRFILAKKTDIPVDQRDSYQPALVGGTPPPGKNPKARRGATKSPLGLIPPPAEVAVAEVFGLGAAKYGAYNWRETRVEAMTYVHAMKRHLASWLDGENQDPESGQSHLAHIAANAMILLDAYAIGKIDDNRPPTGISADLIRALTKKVN